MGVSDLQRYRNLLLPFVESNVVKRTRMVIGSSVNFTSAMTDVDTPQTKAQRRTSRICSPGTERCVSVAYANTTGSDTTPLQLNFTEILQTSFNVVTDVNAQPYLKETLGRFAGVDGTMASNKMATDQNGLPSLIRRCPSVY